MSSAVIASTTPTASRLISIEAWRLARKPVTTTSSSGSLFVWLGTGDVAGCCANAGLITTTPPTMVNSALDLRRRVVEFAFMERSSARPRVGVRPPGWR
jgi:hypothetical protein